MTDTVLELGKETIHKDDPRVQAWALSHEPISLDTPLSVGARLFLVEAQHPDITAQFLPCNKMLTSFSKAVSEALKQLAFQQSDILKELANAAKFITSIEKELSPLATQFQHITNQIQDFTSTFKTDQAKSNAGLFKNKIRSFIRKLNCQNLGQARKLGLKFDIDIYTLPLDEKIYEEVCKVIYELLRINAVAELRKLHQILERIQTYFLRRVIFLKQAEKFLPLDHYPAVQAIAPNA